VDGAFPQHGDEGADDVPQHPAVPITCLSTPSACPDSSSFRTNWSTQHPHAPFENWIVFERTQPQVMMQNAVIVATFAAQAANRQDMLPRKPLPNYRQPARFDCAAV
jgi:hypothetical protein